MRATRQLAVIARPHGEPTHPPELAPLSALLYINLKVLGSKFSLSSMKPSSNISQ